jgi:hypothetical protein
MHWEVDLLERLANWDLVSGPACPGLQDLAAHFSSAVTDLTKERVVGLGRSRPRHPSGPGRLQTSLLGVERQQSDSLVHRPSDFPSQIARMNSYEPGEGVMPCR